jgi:hypothetical protein
MIARLVLLAGTAAALASVIAQAHPHKDGDSRDAGQVKKIVIHKRDGSTSEVDVDAMRDKAMLAHAERCKGERAEVDSTDDADKDGKARKSKVVVCGADGETIVAALEKARAQIADEKALSDTHREKVLASLDRRIEELKAENGRK